MLSIPMIRVLDFVNQYRIEVIAPSGSSPEIISLGYTYMTYERSPISHRRWTPIIQKFKNNNVLLGRGIMLWSIFLNSLETFYGFIHEPSGGANNQKAIILDPEWIKKVFG